MPPLPTADTRTNFGTWTVPDVQLPAVASFLHDVLPNEAYDPHFRGQRLETTYFDTRDFELRKNRRVHEQYLTLRLRCYAPPGGAASYAVSAKTEVEKFRAEVAPALADALLAAGADVAGLLVQVLPANLQARLLDVSHEKPVLPVAAVCCRRYAVEDDEDRYTLDVGVHTDTGKRLPAAILEYKSNQVQPPPPPASLLQIGLRPLKLSKFLWATDWR